jgi:hypothetical protein
MPESIVKQFFSMKENDMDHFNRLSTSILQN